MSLALLLAVSLVLSLAAAPTFAHEYWPTVSDQTPLLGQRVEIGAAAGTGFRGETKLWDPQRAVEFAWHNFRLHSLTAMARAGAERKRT